MVYSIAFWQRGERQLKPSNKLLIIYTERPNKKQEISTFTESMSGKNPKDNPPYATTPKTTDFPLKTQPEPTQTLQKVGNLKYMGQNKEGKTVGILPQ